MMATRLLGNITRSTSPSSGCNETTLAEEGLISLPSVENDTICCEETATTKDIKSCIGNSFMDNSILVPDDSKDETSNTTNSMEDQQSMVSSSLAIINHSRQEAGLDENTICFLNKKVSNSTAHPTRYIPTTVLQFLLTNNKHSIVIYNSIFC